MNTIVAGVLVAILIALAGFGVGHRKGFEQAELEAKVAMDNHLAADRAMELAATQAAADTSTDITEAVNKAATDAYQKGLKDAESKRTAVVADLQSGNLRLRKEWAGCETQRLSDSVAAASQPVDSDRNREEGAGDLVRAAAQCDAQNAGLINAYNAAKTQLDQFNLKQKK